MKFVNKQLAIKLKEKGFDKPCFGWYRRNDGLTKPQLYYTNGGTLYNKASNFADSINFIDAPTIDQVLEWLREKDIIVFCNPFFTMATKNHIMYEWNVDVFNVDTEDTKEDNKNVCLTYVDNDFGYVRYSSFDCFANYDDAILAGIKFVVNDLI